MADSEKWNIPEIVAAVIADDPDAAVIAVSLAKSLSDIQQGKFKVTLQPPNNTALTRKKTGLSQSKFAAAIGISANTLKSWEQGARNPSGAAASLLKLLDKHPELIEELS